MHSEFGRSGKILSWERAGRSRAHPSICWRLYHVTQLGKALNMCAPAPSTTTSKAPASVVAKSSRDSVLDRTPHVAKGYGIGER